MAIRVQVGIACAFCATSIAAGAAELEPIVEAEQVLATYTNPNNGAGPLWCYGAPLVFRRGESAFVSTMETGEGVPPLCNTRWRLYVVGPEGSRAVAQEKDYLEREPCPIVGFADGRVFLSVNPWVQQDGPRQGRCEPQLLQFDAGDLAREPVALRPPWPPEATLTEHSYRGIAADGARGELLVVHIDARTSEQLWCFLDSSGRWSRAGSIEFPIRSCYPQVALRDRAAHVLAIGDIVEPVDEWRAYKREQTQREWDYVFRRLFYTWTPDVASTDFAEPIEIENLEATAGHITNLDLWIAPDGAAHLLYLTVPVQAAYLRDRFFPDVRLVWSLVHTVVRNGLVVSRATLAGGGEGASPIVPGEARFHATGDGRLFVVGYFSGAEADGTPVSETRVLKVVPAGSAEAIRIPLERPFRRLFTNCERGGSAASRVLDLYGSGAEPGQLLYARVLLAS